MHSPSASTTAPLCLPPGIPASARTALRLLQRLQHGSLTLRLPDGSLQHFGPGGVVGTHANVNDAGNREVHCGIDQEAARSRAVGNAGRRSPGDEGIPTGTAVGRDAQQAAGTGDVADADQGEEWQGFQEDRQHAPVVSCAGTKGKSAAGESGGSARQTPRPGGFPLRQSPKGCGKSLAAAWLRIVAPNPARFRDAGRKTHNLQQI